MTKAGVCEQGTSGLSMREETGMAIRIIGGLVIIISAGFFLISFVDLFIVPIVETLTEDMTFKRMMFFLSLLGIFSGALVYVIGSIVKDGWQ